MTTSAQSMNGGGQNVTKRTTSVQSYGTAVPRDQNVNFLISQYYMCKCSSQRPGEVITRDFTDSFITNNFRLPSIINKTPDIQNEKAFPNGM
jgi:hypothetical protein